LPAESIYLDNKLASASLNETRIIKMLQFILRYLTFRSSNDELMQLNRTHLLVGLLFTWLVGVGRYWDHPNAEILQYMGVGSVIYVFVLAAIFWLILKGLAVVQATYFGLLTMITLTSFPAILYAIPVERFMTLEAARSANVWFLAVVAIWRVALFATYLKRAYKLSAWVLIVSMLLPLMAIVSSLFVLNLEHVVFNIMAGISESTGSANDEVYEIVFTLTLLSYLGILPVAIAYLTTAITRWVQLKKKA
jgi:hypothetical protein